MAPFLSFLRLPVVLFSSPSGSPLPDPKIIHLNHAGASPSSDATVGRIMEHLELEQRIGGYMAAEQVQQEVKGVYESIAELVSASSGEEIALVESATVAWTRIFYAAAAAYEHIKNKNVILVSQAEYAAGLVAACQWSKSTEGWSVVPIPSTEGGKVDLDAFQDMLHGEYLLPSGERLDPAAISMVCVTHVPTNAGIANPVQSLGNMIADFNESPPNDSSTSELPSLFYLVDTCQSIGQIPVNVQEIQCHALVGTGRKYLRGPRGTGFLYVKQDCLGLWPHHVDHFSVPVSKVPSCISDNGQSVHDILEFAPRRGASRFEFWESNLAAKLGLGVAVQETLGTGINLIFQRVQRKARELYNLLRQIEGVTMYYKPDCGLVTFCVESIDSETIKTELWKGNTRFEVSVVPATSTPLDSASTKVPNLVRASIHNTTTTADIEAFCERLDSIITALK